MTEKHGVGPASPGARKPPQPAINLIERQGELFDLGTGTDGPAPRPQLRPQLVAKGARPGPPKPVSYRIALRQITDAVLGELKARGEQWPSDARQDLISTLFIAACKEKRVVFDFEPEGE
jgi:hypothetical protein